MIVTSSADVPLVPKFLSLAVTQVKPVDKMILSEEKIELDSLRKEVAIHDDCNAIS
jgi:hypothetical protein